MILDAGHRVTAMAMEILTVTIMATAMAMVIMAVNMETDIILQNQRKNQNRG